jgi:hypothetical protein
VIDLGSQGYLGGIYELSFDSLLIFGNWEAMIVRTSTIMPNYHLESNRELKLEDYNQTLSPVSWNLKFDPWTSPTAQDFQIEFDYSDKPHMTEIF